MVFLPTVGDLLQSLPDTFKRQHSARAIIGLQAREGVMKQDLHFSVAVVPHITTLLSRFSLALAAISCSLGDFVKVNNSQPEIEWWRLRLTNASAESLFFYSIKNILKKENKVKRSQTTELSSQTESMTTDLSELFLKEKRAPRETRTMQFLSSMFSTKIIS